ncbi:MAG: Maf family protein [Verrucomicrobiota bacterium]
MSHTAKIILASGSPRRKDLLEEAGYDFEIIKPDVVELDDPAIPIRSLTAQNAKLKGEKVATEISDGIIIAADTLVLLDDRPLGKPEDQAEAKAMIRSLNGRTHQVYTAVCLIDASSGAVVEFDDVTDVTFKNLSDDELDHYHSLIDPMDKAGAYAAQDHGTLIIEKTAGSLTNVIGLPMERLIEELGKF